MAGSLGARYGATAFAVDECVVERLGCRSEYGVGVARRHGQRDLHRCGRGLR